MAAVHGFGDAVVQRAVLRPIRAAAAHLFAAFDEGIVLQIGCGDRHGAVFRQAVALYAAAR